MSIGSRELAPGRAALAVAGALLLALALLPLSPARAHTHGERTDQAPAQGEQPDERPVEGGDRFETAAQAATTAFEQTDAVVLATGEEFADALAGSTLGGAVDAPVLLSPSGLIDGELPASITDAIDELGADTVYLLGGEGAISEAVADRLAEHASVEAIERVEGNSRFETALEIARTAVEADPSAGEMPLEIDGETRTVRAAFLGTGLDFPDSVAAGPGAFDSGAPVLLTAPETLHAAAETALDELDIEHVFALGGEAAVSQDVIDELEDRGISVERLAGQDRFETAAAIAERLEGDGFDFDGQHVGMTTGADFADALAATSYLGSAQAPLLLGDEGADGELNDAAAEHLQARGCEIRSLHVIGGDGAVGQDARTAAREFAECVSDGDSGGTDDGETDGGQPDNGSPDTPDGSTDDGTDEEETTEA